MKLSIIFPAYNESKRIQKCIEGIIEFKENTDFECEVILVNDGSKDNTLELARSAESKGIFQKVIGFQENQGKGAAVKAGMLLASGEYILISDVDLSTPLMDIYKLLPFANEKTIVIGSRAIKGANIKKHQPFFRVLLGKAGNLAIQLLAVKGIKDTQCGFKLYSNTAAKQIFQKVLIKGFAFDFEALYLGKKLGFKIKEVPITWSDVEGSTVTLKKTLRTFMDLLTMRLNHAIKKRTF